MTAPAIPHFRAIIIGSGFGGILMGIKLRAAGIEDFIILEKAADLGGTWRDNTYPGAACDVQSHLYSYSFEPKPDWNHKFAHQDEINGYIHHCAGKYGVLPHIRFRTELYSARFDEKDNRWHLRTGDGKALTTDILIAATGQLNKPLFPAIEGRDAFQGEAFHSARWNHDHDLAGKRVAVIGTGASAIQFVPEILPKVASLALFQRSAPWVIRKPDRAFRRWEKKLFAALPLLERLYRAFLYCSYESRALAFTRFKWLLEPWTWAVKRRIRRDVRDPQKREALVPDYKIGCKRILLSNDWYPAMDDDRLDLVTDPVARIEADAVVTRHGNRHTVDTIIYGTGFRATEFLSPIHITGRNSRELADVWKDGAEAYKGIVVNGFPNLFIVYGPNTNLGHNSIIYMLESQAAYIMDCIHALDQRPGTALNVKPERQQAFLDQVQASMQRSVWAAGCTSWYVDDNGRNPINWPGFTFSYRRQTKQADLGDFEILGPQQTESTP
ncbi:MAG: NAD(P)/FAD-dependent oxidoreductase [Alcanivoracaceae bacterium]|nr:NAD(P)/FAD-dependent oxidoreductase [Alcanivoracaceae bacterium]